MMDIYQQLAQVKGIVFDVDGVFTNSQLLCTEDGQLLRSMNTRDGFAVKTALEAGLFVGIITGGNSGGVRHRLAKLGIEEIHDAIKDKLLVFKEMLTRQNLKADEVVYMGDDLPDYEVMQHAGIRACPHDAGPEIIALADYISSKNGGEGCVRDLIEKILRAKSQWPHQDRTYGQ